MRASKAQTVLPTRKSMTYGLSRQGFRPMRSNQRTRAQQVDEDDLEELDLRWQVAMLTARVRNFIQKTGRNMDFKEKRPVSLDKSKIECYNCHKKGILLGNAELEEIKGKDLMVTMAGAMHQQMNLHHRHCSSSSSDNEESTPANDRSSKAYGYHAVPPPITRNFLTPRVDISFAYDENDVSEVQTVSPVKTNEIQTVRTRVDQIDQTSQKQVISFKKIKACFVCKSTNHLIKDCNFHDEKIQEPNLKNVINTGPRVNKPVWDNAKRNSLITPVKQNEKRAVHKVSTARPVSTAKPDSTARPVSTARPGNPEILLQDHAVVDSDELKFNLFSVSQMLTENVSFFWVEVFILTRIPVEDVALAAHEKPFESSPKDNDVQDSEDVTDKEGQHQMPEDEQVLHDDLENMIAQEVIAKALDDATRQCYEEDYAASTSTGANADESSFVYLGGKIPIDASTLPNADLPIDPNMPDLEDASDTLPNDGIFNGAYDDDEDVGAVADFNNMDNTIAVSPIPTLRIHKDHPKGQILGDPTSAVQTRGKIQKASSAQQALVLVDLPYGKKVIGTKWVFRNKRDKRSIVVKNKARLIAQGFRHEEGIDYDEVFAPVARIEAIRLFLAFASYMGFTVYQMDVKSAFLYGTIEEEVYVHQPLRFVDPAHPNKVYKVIKALYGLYQAPKAWYESLSSFLVENGFRRGTIDKTLFIKKNKSDIITATTPIESNKSLVKDEDSVDVDVHVYRSMIGSLMYLTALRPDIMFVVCACARFQVTPKASHLNAVKRNFR
ncbi:putative ribonuclease H-like domain-containing protein [Tanacetum coccineum]